MKFNKHYRTYVIAGFVLLSIVISGCKKTASNNSDAMTLLAFMAQSASPGFEGVYKIIGDEIVTSNTSTIEFPNLDGNTDVEYLFTGRVVLTADAACALSIRINDFDTPYSVQTHKVDNTTVTASRFTGNARLASLGTGVGDHGQYYGRMFASTGFTRVINVHEDQVSALTIGRMNDYTIIWNDSTSNITNLKFITLNGTSNIANCFQAPSRITLYSRR